MRFLLACIFLLSLAVLGQSPSPNPKSHQPGLNQNATNKENPNTHGKQRSKSPIPVTADRSENKTEPDATRDSGATPSADKTYKVKVEDGSPDWWTKTGVIVNGILAIAAFGTLLLIKHQRDVMKGQLIEMKETGKQTDKLIEAAKNSADAAGKSAIAAKASADSVINSERAWILLDMDVIGSRVQHITLGGGAESTGIHVSYRCRNVGNSPDWITDKCFLFKVLDSDSPMKIPDLESLGRFEYGPEPLAAGQESNRDPSWETPGRPGIGKFAMVLGVVKYLDIFGQKRVTICGYMLSPDEKRLERIPGPDYNQYT